MTTDWREELNRLPAGLDGDDVRLALAEHVDPMAWPDDGTRYIDAEVPAAFATLVRKAWHPELAGARIAHLYRHQFGGADPCRVVARAKRASAELVHLARVDFLIVYSWKAWQELDLSQRLALVDHELSHCSRDPDRGWIMVPHDLAEFGTIVRRWGAWHPGIETFRAQLDLFTRAGQR
jgi:hypothetical protein